MLTRWRRNPTGLRRAPPSPPAGVGGDHSNLGPADRWRTGDPVPGVSSLPGPLQSCGPAQALSGEATRNVAGKSMTRVPSCRACVTVFKTFFPAAQFRQKTRGYCVPSQMLTLSAPSPSERGSRTPLYRQGG